MQSVGAAAFRQLRGRLRPPEALLSRLRWLFLGVTLFALGTQVVILTVSARESTPLRLAGLAGVIWLGWWWTSGYLRGRFPVAGEALVTLALVVVGVAAKDPEYTLGVVYSAALLRSLYGRPREALLVFVEFAAANLIALGIAEVPSQPLLSVASLTSIVPGLPMLAVIMQVLKHSLERQDRILTRERILRETSAALLGSHDSAKAVQIIHASALEMVSLSPGFTVVRLDLVAAAAEPLAASLKVADALPTVPISPTLANLVRGPGGGSRHLCQQDAGWDEICLATGIDPALSDLLLVPLVVDELWVEVLVVGGPSRAPNGLESAIVALGLAASMALALLGSVQRRAAGEARFRALVQAASDLVLAVGQDDRLVYMSPSVEALLGRAATSYVPPSLRDLVEPDDQPVLDAALVEVRGRPGSTRAINCRIRGQDGAQRTFRVMLTNLLDDPTALALVLTARDISTETALEEQLRHQALHDPLTGLANRVLLGDRLEHALVSRRKSQDPVSLLVLDVDNFKDVNDSFGHGAGDRLLVEITSRIARCLRPADTFARLGGDEFAILMEGYVTSVAAVGLADRIVAAVASPIKVGRTAATRVGVSIGIVTTLEVESSEVILRNADIAMYTAKAEGKGVYRVYHPSLHERVLERLQTESGLRRALQQGELALQYQPVVTVSDGRLTGLEALLRWDDPDRGRIGPDRFIPVAEAAGLIIPIGRWVLREACRQMRAWRASHPELGRLDLAVNVSALELTRSEFVGEVESALREFELPAQQLVLEVTESAVIGDAKAVASRLHELRAIGVRIAVDDFGTGTSSLGQLQRLPVDILKIDRSFMAGLTSSAAGAAVVQSVVELGRALNLVVVAEGVETAEQAAEFEKLTPGGLVQGFFYFRPMDPQDLEAVTAGALYSSSSKPRGGLVPVGGRRP